MGFAQMAALTHKMEDVLELLRQPLDAAHREIVDVLLACLDALEDALDPGRAPPAPRASRPSRSSSACAPWSARTTPARGAARDLPDAPPLVPARPARHRAVHVRATLSRRRRDAVGARLPGAGRARRTGRDPRLVACRGRDRGLRRPRRRGDPRHAAGRRPGRRRAARHLRRRVGRGRRARRDRATSSASASPRPVRVDAERLDQLMHAMGELVAHRTPRRGARRRRRIARAPRRRSRTWPAPRTRSQAISSCRSA